MRSAISVLPFRTDARRLAKADRSATEGDLRMIIDLAPVLARVNPSGLATTIRLMRNLIDPPLSHQGADDRQHLVASVSAQLTRLFDDTMPRDRHRRRR
jgi:hypothetical protein